MPRPWGRRRVLDRLGARDAEAALAACGRPPGHAIYVAGWIVEGGLEERWSSRGAQLYAERDANGDISGLVYAAHTGVLLPFEVSDRALDELVILAKRDPNRARVLVGERTLVERLWERLELIGFEARLVRHQSGYLIDRTSFVSEETLELRPAAGSDLEILVSASAAMAIEEANDDPYGRNPDLFRERIATRIDHGRDLLHFIDGELAFKANFSALSTLGGQVEGVYTLPRFRRRGLGRRGTAAVTRRVLETGRHAFLLVNDDNHEARRIYEALGYKYVVASKTIFVAP